MKEGRFLLIQNSQKSILRNRYTNKIVMENELL